MSYRIRAISFSGIVDYISDPAWKTASVLPITPERALSQQKNPNVNPEDTCLWVAEDDEGDVIGFAGSLPGYDVCNDTRMGWNTCWWVNPERGREVAMPLLYTFLQHWDQRVAFADMTSHTHSIIEQLDFCHTREEKLGLFYLRLPAEKIIRRLGRTGKILSPLVKLSSFLVNKTARYRLNSLTRKSDEDLTISIAQIDEDIFSFIKEHRQHDFVCRTLEEYRWMEQYPWLISQADTSSPAGNYPFSHRVESYLQLWLVSCRKGVIVSVMHLSLRDGVLKVLSYFGDSSRDALEALCRYSLGNEDVKILIFSHPDLMEHHEVVRGLSLRVSMRPRWVGVSRKILDYFPESMVIQLGDGDSSFT